jgi:hypothetical protein
MVWRARFFQVIHRLSFTVLTVQINEIGEHHVLGGIQPVAWQGRATSRAHLVNNSVTRLIDRCRSNEVESAGPRLAYPKPRYASSRPKCIVDQRLCNGSVYLSVTTLGV